MAVAGDILSFDWNFLTSQSPSSSFNDFGLFTLDGTASKLGDTFSPTVGSGTTFIDETGFGTFSFTISATGMHTLGFAVIDVGDQFVNSGLLIDNVQITSAVVPEPNTLTMALSAALVLLGYCWRRSCKQAIT